MMQTRRANKRKREAINQRIHSSPQKQLANQQYNKRYRFEQKTKLNQMATTIQRQQLEIAHLSEELKATKELNESLTQQVETLQQPKQQNATPTSTTTSVDLGRLFELNTLSTHRRAYRLIGMPILIFESLFKLFTQQKPSNHRPPQFPSNQNPNTPSSSHSLSDRLQLLITLYWLRVYPTMITLEAIFNIHERTLTRIIRGCLAILESVLSTQVKWPTPDEFAALLNEEKDAVVPGLEKGVCIVDGSIFRIPRPSNNITQRKYYSGKSKCHCLNTLFVVTRAGRCIFASGTYPGSENDQALWNQTKLRDKFTATPHGIIGDMGFTFNRKSDEEKIIGFTPTKKPKGQASLPAETKEKNKRISSVRVVVEHYFARLKGWRVFKTKFRQFSACRHARIEFSTVLDVVVRLVEWLQDQPGYNPSGHLDN